MSTNQIAKMKAEIEKYTEQLKDENLTSDERSNIIDKIRRVKVRLFLDGVEEEGNDT